MSNSGPLSLFRKRTRRNKMRKKRKVAKGALWTKAKIRQAKVKKRKRLLFKLMGHQFL